MAVFSAVFAWTVSRLAGAVGRDSGRDGPAGATVACGLPNGAVELGQSALPAPSTAAEQDGRSHRRCGSMNGVDSMHTAAATAA